MVGDPYLDHYAAALGRLLANFASLELLLRFALYFAETPPERRMPVGWRVSELQPGQTFPENAMTSREPLSHWVGCFNSSPLARGDSPIVDQDLVEVRNAFAHGRILADYPGPLVLLRFSPPSKSGHVSVKWTQTLTIDWIQEQAARVRAAIDEVNRRVDILQKVNLPLEEV